MVKNSPANAGDAKNSGSIPGSGRSPGVGNGNLLHYSCLENSMDCSLPGSTVHGFSRQEYWSEFPCLPPGDLLDLGMEPESLMSPALAGGFFMTSATWEALIM